MKQIKRIQLITVLLWAAVCTLTGQVHPNLILTEAGVANIRAGEEEAPLFAEVLSAARRETDAEIEKGILVPVPKDMAGGYTHERHKRNFFILQKAGNLYQLTGEEKYAVYVRDMFKAYAVLYPTLPLHPTDRSYATGKIFWQCLNDANWLVYCSQAYDAIYDFLTPAERADLEKNLFRPACDFISVENPKFFNRIHNHSVWGCAAVGMMGLVMDDKELVDRALYGLPTDRTDALMTDDDGGFIKAEGQVQAGFLANLDYSFSPDGHFTEGPYYLRYAMTPFLLFAKSLSHNRPDLNIYGYRDSILAKSVYALLYESDAQGRFFPLNDAQKGMSWKAREVVQATDIAYSDFGRDPMLLSVAEKQDRVTLDQAGFRTAADLARGLAVPFAHKSVAYSDGADGKKGGIGILRTDNADGEEMCVVAKYAAHGMGHGHFDRLSYSLYDEDGEIIQDYGSARWVNIDQKGGGRYLPENQTFAKQTVAHNTLVVNEKSHYGGKVKAAEARHAEEYFFSADNPNAPAVSAKEHHAYPGVGMHRTFFLLKEEGIKNPLFIDVLKVTSEEENQYDLPVWFQGHLLNTNFSYEAHREGLTVLGEEHGYQHLWREAEGVSDGGCRRISWLTHTEDGGSRVRGKIFTLTMVSTSGEELIFARSGADDPNFNLRRDPVFMQRRKAKSTIFISVTESHGEYDPVSEIPINPFGSIESIEVIFDNREYTVFEIHAADGRLLTVKLSNLDNSATAEHTVNTDGKIYIWTGPWHTDPYKH